MSGGYRMRTLVFQTNFRYSAPATPIAFCIHSVRDSRLNENIPTSVLRSAAGAVWIEQAMQMDDEIPHVGVVDGLLRLALPGRVSGGVVREDADNLEPIQILELHAIER